MKISYKDFKNGLKKGTIKIQVKIVGTNADIDSYKYPFVTIDGLQLPVIKEGEKG